MSETESEETVTCSELFYEQEGDGWAEFRCPYAPPHAVHRLLRTGRHFSQLPEGGVPVVGSRIASLTDPEAEVLE